MTENLLQPAWTDLDSAELRLLLDERIGRPGQYSGDPHKLYLPLAGDRCRVGLTFRDKNIVAIERGPAFDAAEWKWIADEIENTILAGPMTVGREYSFSSFRVLGSWRGEASGVQILPPPEGAPQAPTEMAEHPFILEFPLRNAGLWRVTNHRRMRVHRQLTLLLNVLLVGSTSVQPLRSAHLWAYVPHGDSPTGETVWVQAAFLAPLGAAVNEKLSAPAIERLEELDPEEYYARIGHDGHGLRVQDRQINHSLPLQTRTPESDKA